jgi:hypothetical protein
MMMTMVVATMMVVAMAVPVEMMRTMLQEKSRTMKSVMN